MPDPQPTEQQAPEDAGSIPAVLEKMNDIAKHGFDFFLIAAGLVLILAGVVAPPAGWMSAEELLIVAALGCLCLGGGIWVWRQKAQFKFRTYELQTSLEERIEAEVTRRLEITQTRAREKPKPPDFT